MVASCGFVTPLKSQSRFTLTYGFGNQKMANLGLRVKAADRLHIGAFAGIGGDWNLDILGGLSGTREHKDSFASLGTATFYHFSGNSPHTELPPCYLHAGPTYVYSKKEIYTQNSTWADIRAGRAFHIIPRLGIEVDAGINILLKAQTKLKWTAVPDDVPSRKIHQARSIRLFGRF